ncbi:MAG: hypothetical protein QM780_11935 [Hyphomicrobium sp.]|uniref:hypothetical protein n=1 Tax=Hyphomicrobium sp. TaxID=82 RepID=UPI0039E24B33
MRTTVKFAALALATAATVTGFAATEANALPRCRPPVEGLASATGILGAGTQKARIEARENWRLTVRRLYGPRYADFYNAQNTQWDCKKGAILLAKCVVVARPCRY